MSPPSSQLDSPHANALARLETLDFQDFDGLIRWFCEAQPFSDSINQPFPAQKVLQVFRSHGFLPGVNQGDAFNARDRENMARFIIGSALEGLDFCGSIHPSIHRFARQWLELHPTPAA